VQHDIALDKIRYDAASDGCFPLISNDRILSDADVLAAYRYQPKCSGFRPEGRVHDSVMWVALVVELDRLLGRSRGACSPM